MTDEHPRNLIPELCRQFYHLGWCTGTGGGIAIRAENIVYMAPSGVQKERIRPEDVFELDLDGRVLKAPENKALKLTECSPLFFNAFRQRGAGAVLHSHSLDALMATVHFGSMFRVSHVEMIKGLRDYGYYDTVEVPIIENTARECELTESMSLAIDANPQADAVLVRRHGIYVWGRDWQHAKTQAECFDYLFRFADRMVQHGHDPVVGPQG
ncbi:MAG: methylthioribulose 1-phosphate dehydratase [Myxococcales bacterium]|nr:methylthioribulose 1-phosphate dehydratase [Myxococcales bacterium]